MEESAVVSCLSRLEMMRFQATTPIVGPWCVLYAPGVRDVRVRDQEAGAETEGERYLDCPWQQGALRGPLLEKHNRASHLSRYTHSHWHKDVNSNRCTS